MIEDDSTTTNERAVITENQTKSICSGLMEAQKNISKNGIAGLSNSSSSSTNTSSSNVFNTKKLKRMNSSDISDVAQSVSILSMVNDVMNISSKNKNNKNEYLFTQIHKAINNPKPSLQQLQHQQTMIQGKKSDKEEESDDNSNNRSKRGKSMKHTNRHHSKKKHHQEDSNNKYCNIILLTHSKAVGMSMFAWRVPMNEMSEDFLKDLRHTRNFEFDNSTSRYWNPRAKDTNDEITTRVFKKLLHMSSVHDEVDIEELFPYIMIEGDEVHEMIEKPAECTFILRSKATQ